MIITHSKVRARHLLCIAWMAFFTPQAALADDDDEADSFAIQSRQFRLKHEINLAFGTLPINAFTKGLTLGGGYTYHFTESLAWEIAQFHYSFGVDTDLRKELLDNFQVQPTQIESINYFASTNFVWKPLYGKFALLNRHVLHVEAALLIGPALARFLNPGAFRVGGDAGLMVRMHIIDHLSARLDVRYLLFVRPPGVASELHVSLGLAVSFGGGE